MSRMRTATTLAALPLAGLLFTAPTAFGHGEDTHEHQSVHRDLEAEHGAVHRDLNAGHRAGHRELEAEHEAAHQWPMTKKQHRRLHKDLKKEHRAQHRDLEDVHGEVHQDLNAEHRDSHDREWGRGRYHYEDYGRGYDGRNRYEDDAYRPSYNRYDDTSRWPWWR